MKITIEISAEAIDLVKKLAMEVSGKSPTKKELEKFFTQDVTGLYNDSFSENIDDAVESFFGN